MGKNTTPLKLVPSAQSQNSLSSAHINFLEANPSFRGMLQRGLLQREKKAERPMKQDFGVTIAATLHFVGKKPISYFNFLLIHRPLPLYVGRLRTHTVLLKAMMGRVIRRWRQDAKKQSPLEEIAKWPVLRTILIINKYTSLQFSDFPSLPSLLGSP